MTPLSVTSCFVNLCWRMQYFLLLGVVFGQLCLKVLIARPCNCGVYQINYLIHTIGVLICYTRISIHLKFEEKVLITLHIKEIGVLITRKHGKPYWPHTSMRVRNRDAAECCRRVGLHCKPQRTVWGSGGTLPGNNLHYVRRNLSLFLRRAPESWRGSPPRQPHSVHIS